jgi:hypothetical protein
MTANDERAGCFQPTLEQLWEAAKDDILDIATFGIGRIEPGMCHEDVGGLVSSF